MDLYISPIQREAALIEAQYLWPMLFVTLALASCLIAMKTESRLIRESSRVFSICCFIAYPVTIWMNGVYVRPPLFNFSKGRVSAKLTNKMNAADVKVETFATLNVLPNGSTVAAGLAITRFLRRR